MLGLRGIYRGAKCSIGIELMTHHRNSHQGTSAKGKRPHSQAQSPPTEYFVKRTNNDHFERIGSFGSFLPYTGINDDLANNIHVGDLVSKMIQKILI